MSQGELTYLSNVSARFTQSLNFLNRKTVSYRKTYAAMTAVRHTTIFKQIKLHCVFLKSKNGRTKNGNKKATDKFKIKQKSLSLLSKREHQAQKMSCL